MKMTGQTPGNKYFLHASMSVMILSFAILSIVGIVSGFFPALKASRLNPIEALRYE